MPFFRVKSLKFYTGPKKFTRTPSARPWQISGMHLQLGMLTPQLLHLIPNNNIYFKSQSSPLYCPTHPWHTPCSTYQQTRPICKKRRKHFPHDQVHLPLPGIFPIHRGVGDLPCLLHVVLQILERERIGQDLQKRLRILFRGRPYIT